MPLYLFHHFITIFLISCSYWFNFTRIGTAVLVEQDFADIFLPIALMLKYLEQEALCELFFGLFAVAWIPTRHMILPWLYYQIWTLYETPGLNVAEFDPENGAHMNPERLNVFLVALGELIFRTFLVALSCICALSEKLPATHKIGNGTETPRESDRRSLLNVLICVFIIIVIYTCLSDLPGAACDLAEGPRYIHLSGVEYWREGRLSVLPVLERRRMNALVQQQVSRAFSPLLYSSRCLSPRVSSRIDLCLSLLSQEESLLFSSVALTVAVLSFISRAISYRQSSECVASCGS